MQGMNEGHGPEMTEDELAAHLAGHDRSNPSGLPPEGIVHEHGGRIVHIPKTPQPVPEKHHEEGHEDGDENPDEVDG